jgi:hypothetical protein
VALVFLSTCRAQSINLSDVPSGISRFDQIEIIRLWDERFSELSRYQVIFAQRAGAPASATPRETLMQVWRGNTELHLFDWNSADCALQKIQVRTRNGEVYLLVSTRRLSSETIQPQSAPAVQDIEIFKLVDNKEFDEKGLMGRGQKYFYSVGTAATRDELCSTEAVNKALDNTPIPVN